MGCSMSCAWLVSVVMQPERGDAMPYEEVVRACFPIFFKEDKEAFEGKVLKHCCLD